MSRMHWDKSPPPGLARSRPYQGVRVRDPVKELLRRKRSLEPRGARTAPPTAEATAHAAQPAFTRGSFAESPAAAAGGDRWRGAAAAGGGLQTSWSSSEYNQPDAAAQTPAFPTASALTDVYMQTLGPSYAMLAYTHTPLLTNFGAPGSGPQMELPDSGLTYLPWVQPIATISTVPNQVQFGPGSSALPGSPLIHMPLSMSLTTMIAQLEAPGTDHPQRSEHQMDLDLQDPSLDEDPGLEADAPDLLDKLLEERKRNGEEDDKDSYSSSLFISNE
ncbi:POU domain class 2-associating factor 1 [Cyclopterus lumpus]|uniref:POU domain class 2-associating factor 1 n=1 Tax=Cyclopterus lumpus TaxID=8103 RepID=UPI0014874C8F|nr:POU domain class 2-associating factor 1 [Cyclopterus lumpus]